MTGDGQRDGTRDQDTPTDLLDERSDICREIATLLESWRLEGRKRPFRGFNSPPGRF